jgi:hypothetical protein
MTPAATPTLDSRVTIPDDVVFREIDGESVLLDLASGEYYGLNEVGTRIWSLFVAGAGPAQVLSGLRREYEADEAVLRRDLLELLGELQARGLVRIDGG